MNGEDTRLPNPDWVEPADGELVSILMTCEGAKKGVYNAKTGQVEWSSFTFSDEFEPIPPDSQPVTPTSTTPCPTPTPTPANATPTFNPPNGPP